MNLWRGIELLPDDKRFLRHHLPPDMSARNAWIDAYVRHWQDAMRAEPIEHKKQNRGRFEANAWLRETNPNRSGFTQDSEDL